MVSNLIISPVSLGFIVVQECFSGLGANAVEVERMMIEFRELQAGIREKMSAVVFARKR